MKIHGFIKVFWGAIFIVLFGVKTSAQPPKEFPMSEVVSVFESGDSYKKIEALNRLRTGAYDQQVVDYLLGQYRVLSHEQFGKGKNEELLVAVTLANVLLQARRNGFAIAEEMFTDIVDLTYLALESGETNSAFEGVANLAIIDDALAASTLAALISDGSELILRITVLSYSQLCASYDPQQFLQAVSQLSDRQRSIALEINSDFFEFRERVPYCGETPR